MSMHSAKTSLSKSDIDALFEDIDFNFQEGQQKRVINKSCRSNIFKQKPPPFYLNIDTIKDELQEGSEVEVRYGYFFGKKFVPGVPKEAFYNLLKVLEKAVPGVKPFESIDYIIQDGDTNIRIIEKKGKRTIQEKNKLGHKDIPTWGFRIASADEVPFDNPEKELDRYGEDMAGKFIRRKIRYTFPMKIRQWDLTIVTDPKSPHKPPIFEVEIEYYPEALADPMGFEKRVEKDFKDGLMHLYKSSKENILSMKVLNSLMSNYNNLFNNCNSKNIKGRFYEIENKPQSFKFSNIFKGDEYFVTPKLDGLRRRIFIDVNGIFIINPGTRYAQQISGPYEPTPETAIIDTVMDTEYYDKTGEYEDSPKYFPFDVLIFNGVSYLNKPFSERISKARVVNLDMFDFSKPFFRNGTPLAVKGDGNFFDSYAMCIEWQDEHPDIDFDGQIAQTEKPPYKSFTTMKIKPLDELTVDLHTEIDSKGYVTFKSYTDVKKREHVLGKDPRGMKVEKFGKTPIKWKEIRGDGPKKVKSGFIGEYNLLEDHPFIRFKGFRHDKVKPNFSGVVDSVRRSFYIDPITEEDLLGETLLPWRKWASLNKRKEIDTYIPTNSRILDIGVGRGGTLLAAARKAEDVYGIDPDEKNLVDLWKRIDESIEDGNAGWDEYMKDKIHTIVAKGQNTEKVLKFIGTPVDAALSMFSLSFFFESEKDLDALVETMDQSVQNTADHGGVVIVNFMDGKKVGTLLKDGNISTDLYSIKLGHKNKSNKKAISSFKKDKRYIGVPISIKFKKEKNPIFKYQEEWLAPFNLFLNKMKEKGFKVIKNKSLADGAVLPESNKEFADLNRTVVFQRGKVNGKKVRQRVVFKEVEEGRMVGELQPGQTEVISLPLEPLEGKKYLKEGEYTRHGIVWDESSFLRSVLWATDDDYQDATVSGRNELVVDYREEIDGMLDKKLFGKLKKGNVEKRLAFDKLYTFIGDKVIDDKKIAVEAGFIEYKGRVLNGPIGHEIGLVLTELDANIQLYIVDEFGKLLDKVGKGENKVYILKVGNYAYSPLTKE